MRSHLTLLISALCLLALTACSDFLDEKTHGQLTDQEAYRSENDLYLNAVATLYNHVGGHDDTEGLQGTGRGVYDMNTFCTDEAMMPTRGADWFDGGYWQALFLHRFNDQDAVGDTWKYLFKSITLCNQSLERIDTFATLHGESANLKAWRAEVRALRAMFGFYAMDLYGRIPLLQHSVPTASEMRLQPRSVVWRHLISELQQTAPLLSADRSPQPGDHYGRMTRAVNYFLLAKLMLNAQVYADDDWTEGTQPSGQELTFGIDGQTLNAWQATEHYCDLITAMGYRLEDRFEANFAVNNETSVENIFTIPMNKYLYQNQFIYLFRSRHYNHAAALGLNGENGSSATLEAMRTFAYGTDSVDARFALTYYADQVLDLKGDTVRLDDGTPLRYWPMQVRLDLSGAPYEKTAGARMSKYEVDPNGTKDGKQSDNDIVLFRYADVLLMRAEAMVRNGENGDSYLNQVRARVGENPRPATLTNILAERQLELAWEGWRRNDLVRFGQFTRPYSFRPQLDGEQSGFTTVYPIPGDVLTIAGSEQNPGW